MYDFIIIGAGLAGITAALNLNGSILLLEKTNRIGGKLYEDGLGAQWIAEDHVNMIKLINKYGGKLRKQNVSNSSYLIEHYIVPYFENEINGDDGFMHRFQTDINIFFDDMLRSKTDDTLYNYIMDEAPTYLIEYLMTYIRTVTSHEPENITIKFFLNLCNNNPLKLGDNTLDTRQELELYNVKEMLNNIEKDLNKKVVLYKNFDINSIDYHTEYNGNEIILINKRYKCKKLIIAHSNHDCIINGKATKVVFSNELAIATIHNKNKTSSLNLNKKLIDNLFKTPEGYVGIITGLKSVTAEEMERNKLKNELELETGRKVKLIKHWNNEGGFFNITSNRKHKKNVLFIGTEYAINGTGYMEGAINSFYENIADILHN